MREALIDALTAHTGPPPDPTLATRALALALDATLGAAEPATVPIRPAESALLRDWLQRLARWDRPGPRGQEP